MKMVYLSPVPWDSIAQRPHFFVKHALLNGFSSVLWVDPTPSRLPRLSDIKRRIISIEADSFDLPEGMIKVKPKLLIPIEPFGILYDILNYFTLSELLERVRQFCQKEASVLVIGKATRLSLKISMNLRFQCIAMDVMDDLPHFFKGISRKSVDRILRKQISESQITFYSSSRLKEKYNDYSKQSILVLNACDDDFLNKIKNKELPSRDSQLIFGYIGSIASWFDWDLIIELANKYKNAQVRIIGPNYSDYVPELPNNVIIERAIAHCEVSKKMGEFHFGLIPFKLNELTDSVDPVKYYEYIACGCVVISTEFGEMKKRFIDGQVLNFQDPLDKQIKTQEMVTWSARFSPLWKYLKHSNFESN